MNNKLEQFYDLIKTEMGVILATGTESSITMRLVSPVYYNGDILLFSAASSKKYQQLRANPNCCIAVGPFYAEASAKFLDSTMAEKNKELRDAYCAKFPGAFDEGVEFVGVKSKNSAFLPPNSTPSSNAPGNLAQ